MGAKFKASTFIVLYVLTIRWLELVVFTGERLDYNQVFNVHFPDGSQVLAEPEVCQEAQRQQDTAAEASGKERC